MTDLTDDPVDALYAEQDDELHFDDEPEPLRDDYAISRRLATLARRKAALDRYIATQKQLDIALAERRDREVAPLIHAVAWCERSLSLTHQAAFAVNPKATRIVLPNGVLTSTAGTVSWDWPEEGTPEHATLTLWVKEHMPDAYNQPAAPDAKPLKNEIKKAVKESTLSEGADGSQVPIREDGSVLTDDGLVVPGVRVAKNPRSFTPEPAAITGGVE